MTTPVAFTPLPRVAGTELADTPAAQNRFAPPVEANFDLVNPYAAAFPDKLKVRRVSGAGLLTWNAHWTFWNAEENSQGWYYGDVRMLSVGARYTGTRIIADSYGLINPVQPMATLKDSRFLVGGGQQLCVVGSFTGGNSGIIVGEHGVITLISLSEGKASLDPNDFIGFYVVYLVR